MMPLQNEDIFHLGGRRHGVREIGKLSSAGADDSLESSAGTGGDKPMQSGMVCSHYTCCVRMFYSGPAILLQ